VVGNLVVEIEPAEPPVGKVKRHLLAQLPLRANAEAVADEMHPDQQLRVDRGPADVAVKWTQLLVQVAEHGGHEHVDPAQQVTLRDHVIEEELVEKARLISILAPHHSQTLPLSLHQQESPFDAALNSFFDSIDPKPTFGARTPNSRQAATAGLADANRRSAISRRVLIPAVDERKAEVRIYAQPTKKPATPCGGLSRP
jgi:hypothetical protein